MPNNLFLLWTILAALNLVSFIYVGVDKNKSLKPESRRIPEAYFFFLAILFASLGIFLGMLAFRHKIRKFYFPLGIGLLLLEQLYLILFFINSIK